MSQSSYLQGDQFGKGDRNASILYSLSYSTLWHVNGKMKKTDTHFPFSSDCRDSTAQVVLMTSKVQIYLVPLTNKKHLAKSLPQYTNSACISNVN